MPTVTLLAKARNDFQLKHVNNFLKQGLDGLKVEAKVSGVTSRGWVQIGISGEDENVATRYLANEVGLCPERLENVEKFSIMKGYIMAIDKDKNMLHVDVGVFSPETFDAIVPLQNLQACLVDGRKMALGKIVDLFGFCKKLPLLVKISDVDEENGQIEAVVSEKQLAIYRNWTQSLLDRLIILGASISEIKQALIVARCNRDIIAIEPLGMFEHALVCKLGTDAVGLIPRVGRNLRNATFSIYNPRKISALLGC